MKKLVVVLAIFCNQLAIGLTLEQQQEVVRSLDAAKAEVQSVRDLVPGFLRKSVGENLKRAEERIVYARSVVTQGEVVGASYYCTIDSTFDGQFFGRGKTELEASNNAFSACMAVTDFTPSCKKETMRCQKE